MSHPTMGAWIEISWRCHLLIVHRQSHPTMGAWIEISLAKAIMALMTVAPHDGCVDWNFYMWYRTLHDFCVAPHDGCVDWNKVLCFYNPRYFVAPHDGCVDWNNAYCLTTNDPHEVAPHDGCVDWNWICRIRQAYQRQSHPTMGAWIEIENKAGLAFRKGWSHPTMGAWIEI